MAKWFEPSPTQQASYAKWVAERPPAVRAIAERFTPWELYRLKDTGQCVTIVSVFENGTVRVNVPVLYNADHIDDHTIDGVITDFSVFGIDPNDLEPCDVPEHTVPYSS